MRQIVLVCLCLVPSFFSAISQESKVLDRLLQFSGGYLAGHGVHELGHELSAHAVNARRVWFADSQFPFIHFKLRDPATRHQDQVTALGGFVGEVLAAEVIFSFGALKNSSGEINYFYLGGIAQTILNPIIYMVKDGFTEGGWGDYQNYRLRGGDTQKVQSWLFLHSMVSIARLILLFEESSVEIHTTGTQVSLSIQF